MEYTKTVSLLNTSVQSINPDKIEINIYPNPASNTLHVQFNIPSNTKTQIKILNVLGDELLSKQIHNGEHAIDVSELSNGIYFMEFINEKARETRKIIISH